jgi:uncharacterized protein (TIGR03790 family)
VRKVFLLICAAVLASVAVEAQTPSQVLVVVNKRSPASKEIGDYYIRKRGVPAANLCVIDTEAKETTTRPAYSKEIEAPVSRFLRAHGLQESILYIVLTTGVPLRVWTTNGKSDTLASDEASVDSELSLLYARTHGAAVPIDGPFPNPFFMKRDTPFRHPVFPIYLVTRLDGYTMADMKAVVDRSLAAASSAPGKTSKYVIDLRANEETPGNQWLRTAALLLPKERVLEEDTGKVVENVRGVVGYASWGSNDTDRKHRFLHFQWLPGAIATEFVSTDGRTFKQPPDSWEIGRWNDKTSWYAGAPQTLTADYIHEGASGASGQVDEPFLAYCPRPDFILPAYHSGRNLAESFYMGIPALSWMNIVIGDPLMRLAK